MQWRGLAIMDNNNNHSNDEYRFRYIEEKVKSNDERIKGLETLANEFTKISIILEKQQELNEKQDETLTNINDNLTNLNHTTEQLGERVGKLEEEVKDSQSRDNISLTLTFRKVLWTVFSLTVGGLFTWLFSKIKGE